MSKWRTHTDAAERGRRGATNRSKRATVVLQESWKHCETVFILAKQSTAPIVRTWNGVVFAHSVVSPLPWFPTLSQHVWKLLALLFGSRAFTRTSFSYHLRLIHLNGLFQVDRTTTPCVFNATHDRQTCQTPLGPVTVLAVKRKREEASQRTVSSVFVPGRESLLLLLWDQQAEIGVFLFVSCELAENM